MYSVISHLRLMGRVVFCIVFAFTMCEQSCADSVEEDEAKMHSRIPYVVTRTDTVKDMLWIADVEAEDVVYDLGSGDGRIVISAVRDFGAQRAVGIEIDPNLINLSRENAEKAGVADKAKFIQADLFESDFSDADVVALFLGHVPNIELRPKILRFLKPNSRVVSHQFAMGEWKPAKELTINKRYLGMVGRGMTPFADNPNVPDYTGNEDHSHNMDKVFMWIIPAPIAGVWRGQIQIQQEMRELKLVLLQSLMGVNGTFEISGQSRLTGTVTVDLYGSHVRYWCMPEGSEYGKFEVRFDGHVDDRTLNGRMEIIEDGRSYEQNFKAMRDKADFNGTWKWPSATGDRQVTMRIVNHDAATGV